tara:strand:- start:257 stop:634 length:378 start_codon:yes stop_codon:yes gene_type:complete
MTNLSKQYKICIGGYSQGATVAIDAAMTFKQTVPVVSISGFMLNKESVKPGEIYGSRQDLQLKYIHGENDTVITYDQAIKSFQHHRTSGIVLKGYDHWGFWKDTHFKRFFFQFLEESCIVDGVRI